MRMPLAVIIQNYRRPQNIGRIVSAAREALPDTDIFLLDQADEDLRVRDDIAWSEVWFQRAEVNRDIRADFHIIVNFHFADLRKFPALPVLSDVAETVGADHGAGMQDYAVGEPGAGV